MSIPTECMNSQIRSLGVKVRIDDNGEILVKAPTVTPGYYNNPEANAKAFTEDGYFRTGDAGHFTPSGALVLTERVKDLFKTSNGKYIAPQMLESRLAENKYIDEVAVIGDKRKYVTALGWVPLPESRRYRLSALSHPARASQLFRSRNLFQESSLLWLWSR